MTEQITRLLLTGAIVALAACGETARLARGADYGAHPTLVQPKHALIPTTRVATAIGWSNGATPVAAEGTRVNAFARGLDHPRFLYVLPNGDVLVAETNAPPKPDDGKGIKGKFFRYFQKKGGGGVPTANRISLLRDADGDGVAETNRFFSADCILHLVLRWSDTISTSPIATR